MTQLINLYNAVIGNNHRKLVTAWKKDSYKLFFPIHFDFMCKAVGVTIEQLKSIRHTIINGEVGYLREDDFTEFKIYRFKIKFYDVGCIRGLLKYYRTQYPKFPGVILVGCEDKNLNYLHYYTNAYYVRNFVRYYNLTGDGVDTLFEELSKIPLPPAAPKPVSVPEPTLEVPEVIEVVQEEETAPEPAASSSSSSSLVELENENEHENENEEEEIIEVVRVDKGKGREVVPEYTTIPIGSSSASTSNAGPLREVVIRESYTPDVPNIPNPAYIETITIGSKPYNVVKTSSDGPIDLMATIKSMVGTLNKQSVFQIGEFYSLPRFCDLLEGTKWKKIKEKFKVPTGDLRNIISDWKKLMKNPMVNHINLKEIVPETSGVLNIISQIKGYIRDNPNYSIYILEVESKEEVLKWEPYQLSIQFPKNLIIYCEDGAFNAVAGRGHKTDVTTFNNMLRVCQYVKTPLSKWIHTQAIELLGNLYNANEETVQSVINHARARQANQGNTLTVVELKRYLRDISGMYFGGSKSSVEGYEDAIKFGITKNLHQRLWDQTHIRQYEVLYTLLSPNGFNYEYIKQCEKAMKRIIRTKELRVKKPDGTLEHEIFRKDLFAETYSCEDEEIYPTLISAATKVLSHLSSESTESFKLFKKIGDSEWTPIDGMAWYGNDFELDMFEALNGDDETAQASKRKATEEEEDLEVKKLKITVELETKKLDHELQLKKLDNDMHMQSKKLQLDNDMQSKKLQLDNDMQSKKLDYQYKMLEKFIEKDHHKALELFSKMF